MEINKLLKNIKYQWVGKSRVQSIENVTHIAQNVKSGDCFVSLHSNQTALQEIEIAIKNGATMVLTDELLPDFENISVVKVDDIRKTYSLIAQNYFGDCAKKIKMIAVVGTNGKSTTSYLIWQILNRCNVACGLIGTDGYFVKSQKYATNMTTPDPMQLNYILQVMYNCGIKVVVMEVSAHAIYYKKVFGINFDLAIFTNLSQDHLDFFDNMQNLESEKHSFFLDGYAKISLINIDDESGKKLASKMTFPKITYGVDCAGDFFVSQYSLQLDRTKFCISCFGDKYIFESKLIGKFNLYNILSSVICARLCNVRMKCILNCLKQIEPLGGRVNTYSKNGILYVIDFAHTPDGLKNVLKEFARFKTNKLIVVFGAGGGRDVSKRKIMGEVANQFADVIILTSDNPRYEEPINIIYDINSGIDKKSDVYLIENRKNAIQKATQIATDGDIVVIAGKGQEEYFEKNGKKYFYSDKCTLEELLNTKW